MKSWDQTLHVLEHLFSTTFRFPKLPSTHGHANAKNIHILKNFRRSDQNVYFRESEPNIPKIGNTHQDTKNVHISEKIYTFSKKKKNMCFISEKYTHQRENW